MAHLHRCHFCGRLFRCESAGHKVPAWWWCDMQACPDRRHHQVGLVAMLDAEFLQYADRAVADLELLEARPPLRQRGLRCGPGTRASIGGCS